MAFTYQGHISGGTNGTVKTFTIASLAVRKGALLSKVSGSNSVALLTADTAVPILGIACHATTTSSTKVDVQLLPNGSIVEADVYEIYNGSTITATTGATTNFAITALQIGAADSLIGAVIEGISENAGKQITLTGYTLTAGTMTFAAQTTAFATASTCKFIKLNGDYLSGASNAAVEETYKDTIVLTQTGAGGGTCFKVLGVSDDGKRIRAVVTSGYDNTDALV